MPPIVDATERRHVGRPVIRREGIAKLTGRARYVDDMRIDGALTAGTLRSTIAAGRITRINYAAGIPWNEFTIVTAEDLARNVVALIKDDQPALCGDLVRHHQEAILVLAHENPAMVRRGLAGIGVEYEREQGIFEIGAGELMNEITIDFGDPEKEFEKCDIVLGGVYTTGAQEHVYIEPNGFIAWWESDRVILHGSHQCPYYVRKAVAAAMGMDERLVNVVQETTGGGFGGKEDFPSILAIHAAALARKSGRPVRMIYDRSEDLLASTKRHPSRTVMRIGAMKDGTLRALDSQFQIDGGAYVTLSPVVLSRGILHSFGPYKWPVAYLRGKCFRTNSPPYGAFRGFGAPQSEYAIEMHMNLLAEKLGMCPVELRRRNYLKQGDMLPTTQVLKEEPYLDEMMNRTLEMSGYREKIESMPRGGGRGIAVSATFHGTGFTGSGEVYLKSIVALEANASGGVEIQVSSTEIGQGTETIFCQIAAEALEIPIESISFRQPETAAVPNSGPTVASRTCAIVGGLIEKAARKMAALLAGQSVDVYMSIHGKLRTEAQFEAPPDLVWDDETYRGCAYGAYSYACHVAEVAVDSVSGVPTIESIWAVYDIGTVINPTLAIGQVEGGIAQAVGWATCENVVLSEGMMMNARLTNYIIPTSADAPDIVVEFAENPSPVGAYGSKGVGELPMDGPQSAIISAINHAADLHLTKLPALPEDILKP